MESWQEPDDEDSESPNADQVISEFNEFAEDRDFGLNDADVAYLHSVLRHVTNDYPVSEGLIDIEHELINDRVMRLYMEAASRKTPETEREYARAMAEEKLIHMVQYPLHMKHDALDDLGIALIEAGMEEVDDDKVSVLYGALEEFFDLQVMTQKYSSLVHAIRRSLRDGDLEDAESLKDVLGDDILGYMRQQNGIPLESDEQVRQHLCSAKDSALEVVLTCAMDAPGDERDLYLERAAKILAYDVTMGFKEAEDVDPVDYSWAKEFAESLKKAK